MTTVQCDCHYSDADDCAEGRFKEVGSTECPCLCHKVYDLERQLHDLHERLNELAPSEKGSHT